MKFLKSCSWCIDWNWCYTDGIQGVLIGRHVWMPLIQWCAQSKAISNTRSSQLWFSAVKRGKPPKMQPSVNSSKSAPSSWCHFFPLNVKFELPKLQCVTSVPCSVCQCWEAFGSVTFMTPFPIVVGFSYFSTESRFHWDRQCYVSAMRELTVTLVFNRVSTATPRSFPALVDLILMENEWIRSTWYEILNLYSRWHFINYMAAKSWRTRIIFSKDVCSYHKTQLGCHSWGKSQEELGPSDLMWIWFWFHKSADAWTRSCIYWVHRADAHRNAALIWSPCM